MQVRHGLAGLIAVVGDEAEAVADTTLAGHAPDDLQQPSPQKLVVQLRQPGDMLSRHDQDMERRAREDVVDGHGIVVLVHDGRGDLRRDDAAEEAVVHAAKRIATWR